MISFNEWQNETVMLKKYGEVSIKFMLNVFIDELELFIRKNGYNIFVSKNIFGNTIASLLYKLDYNKFYLFPISNTIKFDNLYFNFEHSVNWIDFWKSWNYNTHNFFEEAEIKILHVIWAFIDLEKSDAYIKYMESFEESDTELDLPRKVKNLDPYLLDQMNASNHYKFTRFDNS